MGNNSYLCGVYLIIVCVVVTFCFLLGVISLFVTGLCFRLAQSLTKVQGEKQQNVEKHALLSA